MTQSLLYRTLGTALLALAATSLLQAKTIKDDFTLGGEGRAAGDLLNDKMTPSGNLKWEAMGNLVFGGDSSQGYVTLRAPGSCMGKLPVPTGSNVIQVEADLHPTIDEESVDDVIDGWMGVLIGNPEDWNVQWQRSIFLILNVSGSYSCFARTIPGAPNKMIKAGPAPDYSVSKPNKLKLAYHVKERTIDAWINGEQVIENYVLDEADGTPEPDFVGFSGFGIGTNAPTVESFSMTLEK